tara:strand:+ start:381 stop:554 length:174 start_codon:yes stop_codon:yes gene_type:complete
MNIEERPKHTIENLFMEETVENSTVSQRIKIHPPSVKHRASAEGVASSCERAVGNTA